MAEQPTIVLEQASPSGSLMAVVEDDGAAIYLHLIGAERSGFDPHSVWVRNRVAAPMELASDWRVTGRPPLLPFSACAYPAGMPAMDPESLSTIWFPAGDAVALLEHGRVVAVVPPWAGVGGCAGYARDCTAQTPVAWPLGGEANNPTLDRVRAASNFWAAWEDGSPWRPLQESLISAIERSLGAPHRQYYSIDGGQWPPRFLVRVDTAQAIVLVTGGMCIRPQPQVHRHYPDPSQVRRVELALAIDPSLEPELARFAGALSRLSAFPWSHNAWLDHGHTLPERDLAAVLLRRSPAGAPPLRFDPLDTEPVNPLWVTPLTTEQRALAMESGSGALSELSWTYSG